jgi:MFS family permease
MILIGLGMGMSFNPILLTAMSEVAPSDARLASGVVNTSFRMGGAVGLAVLASVADSHTSALTATGLNLPAALTSGSHAAFLTATVLAATATMMGTVLLRPSKRLPGHTAQESPAVGLVPQR